MHPIIYTQNMKKLLPLTILLFINIQFIFSQDSFKLSRLKNNDVPVNEKVHLYLFQLENNSNQTQTYSFKVENANCTNHQHGKHSELKFEFYDISKSKKLDKIVVDKNQKSQFFVKTIVPSNAKLSTWNCSNVISYNIITNEKQLVNIVSFIQDPKKAN